MDAQAIVNDIWNKYVQKTPQRVKLLDSFLAFLVAVGVLQFVYCVIVGNFVRLSSSNLSSFPVSLLEYFEPFTSGFLSMNPRHL